MELDAKDRRILSILDFDARATLQKIGKKARLSKEVVLYRINRLKKKGVIQGTYAFVNFAKLGLTGFAVFSRLENAGPKSLSELIKDLKAIEEVYWIGLCVGKFDIAFGLVCRSVFEFNTLYRKILNNHRLTENAIAIRAELRLTEHIHLQSQIKKETFFGREPSIEKIDPLDSKILSLLSYNADASILDLATLLHKPARTISNRIKRLEHKGIIQGYVSRIRTEAFGLQNYRILIALSYNNELLRNKLFTYASQNPCIWVAIETVGHWNFEIVLEVKNSQQLQEELIKLRNEFGSAIKQLDFLLMIDQDHYYDPYPFEKSIKSQVL